MTNNRDRGDSPYRPREISGVVAQALDDLPVVVVTGLRQAGKTTFLHNDPGLAGRRYRSLDDFAQLAAAERDPQAFVQGDDPLTIDEAQKCPALLTAVKQEVGRRRRPGRFLLSGSANLSLLRHVSESLAGRAVYLTLHPLSRREIAGGFDQPSYLRQLFDAGRLPQAGTVAPLLPDDVRLGGMPSVCLGEVKNSTLWFKGYEQTYLERDVRDLARVTDLVVFRHLLRLAALRTGQLLNLSDLARDAKLNVQAVRRQLDLMEATYVLSRMGPSSPTALAGSSSLPSSTSGIPALPPFSPELPTARPSRRFPGTERSSRPTSRRTSPPCSRRPGRRHGFISGTSRDATRSIS